MSHHHEHEIHSFGRAFAIGVTLNSCYVIVEAVFGFWTRSLALIADAGHNVGDVFALLLAWGASVLVKRSASSRRTYGMRRATILAAFINSVVLMAAVGAIAWEAILRFWNPEPTQPLVVMIVATIGIAINAATAWLFASGCSHDANIRGAFLHMAADAAVSLGVVVAAILYWMLGWQWLDPAISLVIVGVIAWSTIFLLRDSVNLIMDAVPPHIDPSRILKYLEELPEVRSVHDLHIWGMSTTEVALTAHLVKSTPDLDDRLLHQIQHDLHELYGISHATIQFESGDGVFECHQANGH